MPQYFFNFINSEQHSADECGVDFVSADEAYLQAYAAAQAMWPELLEKRVDPTRCAFEITDEDQNLLFRLPFIELLERCQDPKVPIAIHSELAAAIETSHARARSAHAELRSCMTDARRSLDELTDLLRLL